MANWSADEDLRKYLSDGDYDALPLPLEDLHTEATRQMTAHLYALGYEDDDIADFDTTTDAALKEICALRVLQLFFSRFGDTMERAGTYAGLYREALNDLRIGTDDDDKSAFTATVGTVRFQ